MSLGRFLAVVIVLLLACWVFTRSGLFTRREAVAVDPRAPIERAREVSAKSSERDAVRESVQSEADSNHPSGAITENMSPDQVRAFLGPPSEIQSETTDTGVRRERWIYSSVGKTVVFENGIVVSVQ